MTGPPGRLLLSPPHLVGDERDLLLRAVESNWVAPVGPDLDAFEQDVATLVGVAHAVALSSGTAALHLALLLAGVGSGSRVLVPSFTFAATANAVAYLGAEPVFVDSTPDTWAVDPALVREELDRAARRGSPVTAVVPVDVYGQCADYDVLGTACADHGVGMIEDAAEALGSTYRGRPAGSFGLAAVISFNGNKIVTTGGGGMLLTSDGALADRARYLATQARDPVPHYEHRTVGYNYRLSNLLAAVGRGQLRSLTDKVAARRHNYQEYARLLCDEPGLTLMPQAGHGRSNCWLTCLTVDTEQFGADPSELLEHLAAQGIEARPTWKPMHLQPAFRGRRMVGGAVCEDLFARGVCLPSGSALTELDRQRVVDGVRSVPRRVHRRVAG